MSMNKTIKDIGCFVFDIDGTLCLGNTIIDGAIDLIDYLRQKRIPHYFFTNNSSKSPLKYVEKLDALGINNDGVDSILTSGNVTADYILKHANSPTVYLCGTNALKHQFESLGIKTVDCYGEKIDFVVLGFDTELDFKKLTVLTNYLIDDIPYIATNIDDVCPLEKGRYLIDCGSMAKMIGNATGKYPKFLGKPSKETVDFILSKTNMAKHKIAIVGDRLYTDMKTAVSGGVTAIAVLSGEMTMSDIEASDITPTYIFDSAKELLQELKR
jgi:HAD superfamily hydrolase (TIGR01450 family)